MNEKEEEEDSWTKKKGDRQERGDVCAKDEQETGAAVKREGERERESKGEKEKEEQEAISQNCLQRAVLPNAFIRRALLLRPTFFAKFLRRFCQ